MTATKEKIPLTKFLSLLFINAPPFFSCQQAMLGAVLNQAPFAYDFDNFSYSCSDLEQCPKPRPVFGWR
jgi:hypothetical protein